MFKKYILLFFLVINLAAHAQFAPLSDSAEISIITIGPGSELYDKFGHSAFRINDPQNERDVVFNYGVYDFDTPNFYTKFAQGKLLYELGVANYEPFFQSYVRQNRWVKEQILNLNQTQKQEVSDFLWKNAAPENKKYKYDFFFDNCATKIRDVMQIVLGDKLIFSDSHITEIKTFRELIQQNLASNSWGSMGIDIALGAVIDRDARPIEYQFLPDYVFSGAENAMIKSADSSVKYVKSTNILFENSGSNDATNFFLSPLFILGILSIIIIYITYRDHKNETRTRVLDLLIFFITGLIGILIMFLWFGTDHTATADNYNLLWAFPLSILFFVAVSKIDVSPKIRRYIFLLLLCISLLVIHWITGVQVFAIGLIPLLIAFTIRYIFLIIWIPKEIPPTPEIAVSHVHATT